ncbi:hypothetical protein SAMN04487866_1251, partial [Thermoactinomyces sp. DSM 45891]
MKRKKIPFYSKTDNHFQQVSSFLYGNLMWWLPLMAGFAVKSGIPFYVANGCLAVGLCFSKTRDTILKTDRFFRDYWRSHRDGMKVSKMLRETML